MAIIHRTLEEIQELKETLLIRFRNSELRHLPHFIRADGSISIDLSGKDMQKFIRKRLINKSLFNRGDRVLLDHHVKAMYVYTDPMDSTQYNPVYDKRIEFTGTLGPDFIITIVNGNHRTEGFDTLDDYFLSFASIDLKLVATDGSIGSEKAMLAQADNDVAAWKKKHDHEQGRKTNGDYQVGVPCLDDHKDAFITKHFREWDKDDEVFVKTTKTMGEMHKLLSDIRKDAADFPNIKSFVFVGSGLETAMKIGGYKKSLDKQRWWNTFCYIVLNHNFGKGVEFINDVYKYESQIGNDGKTDLKMHAKAVYKILISKSIGSGDQDHLECLTRVLARYIKFCENK